MMNWVLDYWKASMKKRCNESFLPTDFMLVGKYQCLFFIKERN